MYAQRVPTVHPRNSLLSTCSTKLIAMQQVRAICALIDRQAPVPLFCFSIFYNRFCRSQRGFERASWMRMDMNFCTRGKQFPRASSPSHHPSNRSLGAVDGRAALARGAGIGELRQTGHVGCICSHWSTHFLWKTWWHSGNNLRTSLSL